MVWVMIRTMHSFLFIFVIALSSSLCRGAVKLDALGAYLVSRGYGGAQLIRSGQYYHLPIVANGKPAHLVVDTGAPTTVIFRQSLKALNLTESKTEVLESGIYGRGKEAFGTTKVETLTAGNCTLSNVPVAVAGIDAYMNPIGRPNGLLGLRELVKFGAILDFPHRLLYLRPSRPGSEVAASIKSILEQNNFKAIAFSVDRGHMRVPGKVNDIACHFMVDSGAFLTVVDRDFAARAKIASAPTRHEMHGVGKSGGEVRVADFSSLWVGDYQIKRASSAVAALNSQMLGRGTNSEADGLLGVEYLGLNSAIIDFISGTIYLRPRPK
jgi:predicted aspartyl protease